MKENQDSGMELRGQENRMLLIGLGNLELRNGDLAGWMDKDLSDWRFGHCSMTAMAISF